MWKLFAGASVLLALIAGAIGYGLVAEADPSGVRATGPASAADGEPGPERDERAGPGSTSTTSTTRAPVPPRPDPDQPVEPEARALPTGLLPVGLWIPAIDLRADIVDITLAGPEPEVPSDFDQVGWYRQTRYPGEIGPAIFAGHIDSTTGPAVFSRLDELVPGDRIVVNGYYLDERTFEVTATGQYPKDELPDEVFGFGEPVPELRLITCGGTFDRRTNHYVDNYVVYAREVAP